MAEPSIAAVDFDALKRLAASDPQAFEELRRKLIEEAIARAPEVRRERLRRLQWRIEQASRRAGTPLAACIAISNMMWDSVAGRHGLLEALRMAAPPPHSGAKVLPFNAEKRH
jgi:hypothetical protein